MRTSTIPAEAPAFERAYPGTASQPRHVRADLAAVADGCPAAESLLLLASELATNASAPRGALSYPRCSRDELEGGSWV
jgi:hypothetical protein